MYNPEAKPIQALEETLFIMTRDTDVQVKIQNHVFQYSSDFKPCDVCFQRSSLY